jgi:hypothetical protein
VKINVDIENRLENYWFPKFGSLLISAINSAMIDDWYMDLDSKRSGKELSDNSKNKILACGNMVNT